MGMTPVLAGGASKYEVIGADTASSSGTSLTANATPGSDGAWTQISAAIANDWYSFTVEIIDGGAIDDVFLVDIAIGAGGSELVLLADIPVQQQPVIGRMSRTVFWVPLYISKGTRVSARIHRSIKASTVTKVILIGETPNTRALPPYRRATTYGTVLASAIGTNVDAGAVANTQGSIVEIVSSITNPIRSLLIIPTKPSVLAVTASTSNMLELFVGAGGSEVSLIPEFITWRSESISDYSSLSIMGLIPVNLPSGTRISSKARCNVATANDRVTQVTLIGFD